MKFRLPKSFEYGNYGGPNHSGEGTNPITGETKSFVKDPIDGLDTIFRKHDEAYRDAEYYEKQGNWQKALEIEHAADKALVDAVKAYDPYNDPLAREGYTDQAARDAAAAYKWKAQNAFEGIINHRDNMYPGIGTKPFNEIDYIKGAGIGIDLPDIINLINNIAGYFDAAANFRPADPITFDLDGDGIETIEMVRQYSATPGAAFTPTGDPVMFDHDGDGVKMNTGWIAPDDGMLVLDRNGNGVIDSGKELFGDSTFLYTGGTAADGFAALKQEDSNLDGVVNHLDANWTNLKVWRDLNSVAECC